MREVHTIQVSTFSLGLASKKCIKSNQLTHAAQLKVRLASASAIWWRGTRVHTLATRTTNFTESSVSHYERGIQRKANLSTNGAVIIACLATLH